MSRIDWGRIEFAPIQTEFLGEGHSRLYKRSSSAKVIGVYTNDVRRTPTEEKRRKETGEYSSHLDNIRRHGLKKKVEIASDE